MADCYFHGYSGGPGGCSECEAERREGLEQGTLTRPTDEVMTLDEMTARARGITLEQLRKVTVGTKGKS